MEVLVQNQFAEIHTFASSIRSGFLVADVFKVCICSLLARIHGNSGPSHPSGPDLSGSPEDSNVPNKRRVERSSVHHGKTPSSTRCVTDKKDHKWSRTSERHQDGGAVITLLFRRHGNAGARPHGRPERAWMDPAGQYGLSRDVTAERKTQIHHITPDGIVGPAGPPPSTHRPG